MTPSSSLSPSAQEALKRLRDRPAGSVVVFGSGDCGQLGLGEDMVSCPRPRRHPFFEDKRIVSVVAGGLHTLALSAEGRVYSWGCNDEKALGHTAEEFTVSEVTGLGHERIIQVACGDSISAALSAEGRIYTWGTFRDSKGVIGVQAKRHRGAPKPPAATPSDNNGEDKLNLDHFHITPTALRDLEHVRVRSIAAGANHLLALAEDGEVYAWGCGEQGQLGRRVLERHKLLALHPTRITPRRHRSHGGIMNVVCGSYHSFLLARDGTVFAVGLNNYGQLGLDDHDARLVAEEIGPDAWQGHKIVELAAGEHHSMALASSGRVFVFGRADSGQMGLARDPHPVIINHHRAHPAPLLHPTLKDVTAIAAGSNHNLAIVNGRSLWSWGFGEMGQLGHDEEADEMTPRHITAFSDTTTILDVSAGGQHTVALIKKNL